MRSRVFVALCIGFVGSLGMGLASANPALTPPVAQQSPYFFAPRPVAQAPEIDPGSAISAVTLLFGGLAMLRQGKRK